MIIQADRIEAFNRDHIDLHQTNLDVLYRQLTDQNIDYKEIIAKLKRFQVAVPSWALGAGGTRFGRFSTGGEPGNLEEKIDDLGLLHQLTKSTDSISLHIPWDIPGDIDAIKQRAVLRGIHFDAVNSNTFQDQPGQKYSYKFGSLSHVLPEVRNQAIKHNLEVIEYGKALGSKSITIWLADGTSFPGQHNFRLAYEHTRDSLKEIYEGMPDDWKMYIEYKPYEPNFYSMVIPDWGTSLSLAQECGARAYTLVDLGHHLPNTNIEQIVSNLLSKGRLGGFHFNDSKYGDDDLTTGSIKPYQLFLIFQELVFGMSNNLNGNPPIAWMIDASHNLKDPLEDLMQSLEAIRTAYAKALLVDQDGLKEAQLKNDVTLCQEILQNTFRTDIRSLLREARLQNGGALDPIKCYRELAIRKQLVDERGSDVQATGL